jgi:hypothetical protein
MQALLEGRKIHSTVVELENSMMRCCSGGFDSIGGVTNPPLGTDGCKWGNLEASHHHLQ